MRAACWWSISQANVAHKKSHSCEQEWLNLNFSSTLFQQLEAVHHAHFKGVSLLAGQTFFDHVGI